MRDRNRETENERENIKRTKLGQNVKDTVVETPEARLLHRDKQTN